MIKMGSKKAKADIGHMLIAVNKLFDVFVVWTTWGGEVTPQQVRDCIAQGVLENRPWNLYVGDPDHYNHAARIAYLCVNRDPTPIEIDVGIPSLGYYRSVLVDGNHRAAAAHVCGDTTIVASVSGEIDYATHLFVYPLDRYKDI